MINLANFEELYEALRQKAEDSHASDIGRVAISWNLLQVTMFTWFCKLLPIPHDSAKALWECAAGDGQQSDMLLALSGLIPDAARREDFIWSLKRVKNFAQYRNTALHTPMELEWDTWSFKVREDATKTGHINRMKLLQEKNLFKPLDLDLSKIDHYLFKMLYTAYAAPEEPWPERPQLTNLLWQEQAPPQKIPHSS